MQEPVNLKQAPVWSSKLNKDEPNDPFPNSQA